MDLCQTDYLIMASDDDVYEPNYLEEIDALTEKYPEVDLYRGRVKRIDGDGDVIEKDYILEEKQSQIDFLFDFYQRDMVKCIANYVFRKDSLVRKGYFYEMPLAWGSDDITVLNMSENGICNTPSLVFSFRMSSENISGADTARTVRIKTGAMYSYIHYLNRYLDEMKGRLSSKLEQRQWRMVKGKINTDSYYSDSVYNGAAFSPYKEMMSYYHYLLEIGYITGKLEALHFFWTWLRAYKVR